MKEKKKRSVIAVKCQDGLREVTEYIKIKIKNGIKILKAAHLNYYRDSKLIALASIGILSKDFFCGWM